MTTPQDEYEAKLSTIGLGVPVGFPFVAYETVHKLVGSACGSHTLYQHYAGGWNALGYRYRACIDCGSYFIWHLEKHGASPPHEERYVQERTLFDFFGSAFSVFECAFYALYALGGMIQLYSFPLATDEDQRRVTPAKTRDTFSKVFPTDPILVVLSKVLADPDFERLRSIRNVLTHRTAPGRHLYVGSDDLPKWKLTDAPLDRTLIENSVREINRLLGELVCAVAVFVDTRFASGE